MKSLIVKTKGFSVFLFWLAVVLPVFTGCMLPSVERKPDKHGQQAQEYLNYEMFTLENMENLDHIYSADYQPYPFVVDMESGSTIIQNLIDTERAGHELRSLGLGWSDNKERLMKIYNSILESYTYVAEPVPWLTVEETIRWRRGDCKGLSLLLLSMLLAADYDVRAEISNGHMWVNVNIGDAWRILELDLDSERKQIYSLPGFYENPLYKIYQDRTEKRVPKKHGK
jgi:hypothetical protein